MSAKKLKHYKQARYRKRRAPINKKLVLVVISGILMLAGSIALGNYLNHICALPPVDTAETESTTPPDAPYDKYPQIEIERTSTLPLPLDAYLSEASAERAVMKAAGELVRALSFNITDERGVPSYKSEVYEKAYSAPSGKLELDKLILAATRSDVRLSGIMSYRSGNAEYADIREIRESYELGIIGECYSLGIRNIILTDIETKDPDALYSVLCKIKERAPDLAVGILLSGNDGGESTLFWQKVADAFDFIALDYTAALDSDLASDEQTDEQTDKGDKQTDKGDDEQTGEADGEQSNEPKYRLAQEIARDFYLIERHGAIPYVALKDDSRLPLAKEILASTNVSHTIITIKPTIAD